MILMSKKTGEETKETSVLHRDLPTGSEFKTACTKDGKRGHIIKHKYMKVAWTYKNKINKTKAQNELGLVKDAEEKQKWFP